MTNKNKAKNQKVNEIQTNLNVLDTLRSPQEFYDYLISKKNRGKYKNQHGAFFIFLEYLIKETIKNPSIAIKPYMVDLARKWGFERHHLSFITRQLQILGLIKKTYIKDPQDRMYQPTEFKLTRMLRDPKMEQFMVQLFPFLKPIAFSFFCMTNSFEKYRQRYLLKHDRNHINNSSSIKNYYNYNEAISSNPKKVRDENHSTRTGSSTLLSNLQNLGLLPKI